MKMTKMFYVIFHLKSNFFSEKSFLKSISSYFFSDENPFLLEWKYYNIICWYNLDELRKLSCL